MLTTGFWPWFVPLFESFHQISRETYGSMLYIIAVCTLLFSIFIAQNTHGKPYLYNPVWSRLVQYSIYFMGYLPLPAIGCLLILIGIIAETKLEFLHGRLVAGKPLAIEEQLRFML